MSECRLDFYLRAAVRRAVCHKRSDGETKRVAEISRIIDGHAAVLGDAVVVEGRIAHVVRCRGRAAVRVRREAERSLERVVRVEQGAHRGRVGPGRSECEGRSVAVGAVSTVPTHTL